MIIIAEKINATLPAAKKIILERDEDALLDLAQKQAQAGAAFLDVNVGAGEGGLADEVDAMAWAVRTIQEKIDTAICVDSADPEVLAAGLGAREGRPSLINSVKAEEKALAAVLPLAVKHNAPLIGLAMDESGIPKTVEGRINACARIGEACAKFKFPWDRLYLDPLVLPVSTDTTQGMVTLETVHAIQEKMHPAKTVMGLSNISFMLPGRAQLNAAFLHMAAAAGLDAVIGDPLDRGFMNAIRSAEVLAGKDRHCRRYTRSMRKLQVK